MNRLQKKCVIAATGFHVLLLLLLFVGPAFFSADHKSENVPLIDFVPVKVIEANLSGGGNPNANPLPPNPAPRPPEPVAPPDPVEPPPVVARPEPPKLPDPEVLEAKPDKPKKPQISLKPIVRKPATQTTSKPAADTKAADTRRQVAEEFSQAAAGLRNNLAPTTSIDLRGPGGGGETYAGFEQNLLALYDRAWISPEGMDTSEAVVGVKVVIEPGGAVSSALITRPSGDARVDRSVREALNRVPSVPVPETMKQRRTVEFNFRSRTKQSI